MCRSYLLPRLLSEYAPSKEVNIVSILFLLY